MFHILGFLFILIIAILFIGFAFIGTIVRTLFGGRRRNTYSSPYGEGTQNRQIHEENQADTDMQTGNRKKIFTKDEGEYVDFEEV